MKEELKYLKNLILNEQKTGNPYYDKPWENGKSYFERNPIIPNFSVYNTIKLLNTFYQNKTAIDCIDLQVNYREMFNDSVTISLALKELGVKKGDIVGICMPNYYQAVASFLACNRIGAITTFINSSATKKEITDYLNLYESNIFINFDSTKENNLDIKKNTNVKYIITLSKENRSNLDLKSNYKITSDDDLIDFNSLESISKYQKKHIENVKGSDDSLILYTSGTTGKPKSVVLTNRNIVAAGIYQKNTCLTDNVKGDKTLVCVPFTYPYGFCTSTLLSLMSNKTAILGPDLSKETINYYLSKKPNIIFGSPALLELIMNNAPNEQDLSSISNFVSGGDFLTPQAAKRGQEFFEKHGAKNIEISNGSGNAETVSCGTGQTGIKIKPETAGVVLVGTDAMIIDPETMQQKNIGEEGMLCISGEHVFKEYYKDEEKTKEAKFNYDGKTFFKTGTMGFIDDEGYFNLTGRMSRFYIMSTLNKVYLDHVQSIISSFDCVKDCAVVKVVDEDMLYVNKVYIELNDNYKNMDINEIISYIDSLCRNSSPEDTKTEEQLMWYEVPKYIEIVDSLPRKPGTEKINYGLLEQDASEKKEKHLNIILKR